MRWGYKTVFFGLKKDGLLGSAFLDDAEIEVALNEYGRAGWELVSIFETRDGVIAVFKQPLGMPLTDDDGTAPARRFASAGRVAAAAEPVIRQRVSVPPREEAIGLEDEPVESFAHEPKPQYDVADDEDGPPPSPVSDDEPALFPSDDGQTEDDDDGIGGIRIE